MLHMRRYRYYVLFTAAVVLLLYQFSRGSEQWHPSAASIPANPEHDRGHGNSGTISSHGTNGSPQQFNDNTGKGQNKITIPDLKNAGHGSDDIDHVNHPPTSNTGTGTGTDTNTDTGSLDKEKQVFEYDKDGAKKETSATLLDKPDKKVGQGAQGSGKDVWDDKKTNPDAHTTTTTVHWTRPTQHFPIPEEDMISLPAGKPKKIPSLQYPFEKETKEARLKREDRQEKVKLEMERSWAGYMEYARGHDELSPVSKRFRDPFCGWAATLVDSLDTLWIMDMRDEFEEALSEVEKIDFTTSATRTEIPVFETTIRYLGGLIAAYDVSGAMYDILLQKALELAEILMGVFDTPNHMPILYYNWKPEYTSKPRRAGASVSVAELGSLAMEFTRLAQITKENKYYDAVARITNAFYEWQERGTTLSGIFPEHVDASGCNRTAQSELDAQTNKLGAEDTKIYARNSKPELGSEAGEISEGELHAFEKRRVAGTPDEDATVPAKVIENGEEIHVDADTGVVPKWAPSHPDRRTSGKESRSTLGQEPAEKPLPGCVPQGLAPASWLEQYSMGGSQDSTYEYFPKQFLLLGGLEPKYRTLHVKTTEAVKKWLLYRPMLPDNRDIRFTSKMITRGEPEVDATTEYEVTHLTCFIGGMFGVGGKIFDIPEDVEIGKKLTDGCIWAYESTASGIMPEGAHVVPCPDMDECSWNQTMYDQLLDPLWATRSARVEEYYKERAEKKQKAKEEAEKKAAEAYPSLEDNKEKSFAGNNGIRRRAPPSKIGSSKNSNVDSSSSSSVHTGAGQIPLQEDEDDDGFDDPARPISHEEFIAKKVENEKLPTGYVDVNFKRYILRPEAIESVWYMYRITGDKYWQDKGWKMFSAIVSQTRTDIGNSAIDNVLVQDSRKVDEMESFWTAETLKYFYLLYSDPTLISLDEWVLNTEAHPFKRPT